MISGLFDLENADHMKATGFAGRDGASGHADAILQGYDRVMRDEIVGCVGVMDYRGAIKNPGKVINSPLGQ